MKKVILVVLVGKYLPSSIPSETSSVYNSEEIGGAPVSYNNANPSNTNSVHSNPSNNNPTYTSSNSSNPTYSSNPARHPAPSKYYNNNAITNTSPFNYYSSHGFPSHH